jgi:hypothetical protein
MLGVFKVQASLAQRDFALGLVVPDLHIVNVATKTRLGKLRSNTRICDVERRFSASAEGGRMQRPISGMHLAARLKTEGL